MKSLAIFEELCWIVIMAVVVLAPLSAQAAVLHRGHPLVPRGMGDGDNFHLAFVTNSRGSAYDSDIEYYNNYV